MQYSRLLRVLLKSSRPGRALPAAAPGPRRIENLQMLRVQLQGVPQIYVESPRCGETRTEASPVSQVYKSLQICGGALSAFEANPHAAEILRALLRADCPLEAPLEAATVPEVRPRCSLSGTLCISH